MTGVLATLRSLTSVNAALLRDDRLGRVAPGACGDVLVFDGDPFERPELLWAAQRPLVILDGVPVAQDAA